MSTREQDAATLASLADDLEMLARIRIGIVRERIDETLATSRRLLLRSLAFGSAVIVAVVLLVRGVAGGVSVLVPGREWLAELLTGAVVLGALFLTHRVRRLLSRRRRLRALRRELQPRPRDGGRPS
jgi:cytochrome c biogenesis protein CcdA